MHIDKEHAEEGWISLILRLAMASLFGMAALGKFKMGLPVATAYVQSVFKDNWLLPDGLVTLYGMVLPFAEATIAVWLLTGIRLRAAWIFTAFVLISLAFGMMVAKQYAFAASNYVYVLMACAGLYFSRYDCCGLCKKK